MKMMNNLTLKTRRIKNKYNLCKGHVYNYTQKIIINEIYSIDINDIINKIIA